MTWHVELSTRAQRALDRAPDADRQRLLAALRQFAVSPFTGDIKRLEGPSGEWRRRVGSWRIRFAIDRSRRRVLVNSVARRTSTMY